MTIQAGQTRDGLTEQTPFRAEPLPGWERLLPRWLIDRPKSSNLPAPLTILILLAVLGLALLTPYLTRSLVLFLVVVAAVVGPIAFIVLSHRPILGIWALPVVAFFVHISIGTGSQTGVNAAVLLLALLLALWLVEMLAAERRITLLPYPAIKASLVFCVVSVIAFGFGQVRWFPTGGAPLRAQIGGLAMFILAAMTILLAAHRIRSMDELERLIWVFFACGAVYVLVRSVPPLSRYFTVIFVRAAAQGVIFYIWLASLGLAQILVNPRLSKFWKVAIALMLLGLAYLNLVKSSAWVSGWLPPLVAVAVVVFLVKPRLAILGGIAFGLIAIFYTGSVFAVFSEGDNVYSTNTRLAAWRILWEIVKMNPFFGVGMANYYFFTPYFPILGYYVSFNSHNNYVDIAAQAGFVGLLALLVIYWTLFQQGWSLYSRLPDGRERAYVIGAIGGLAGTIVAGFLGDWVIPFVYNIGLEGFRASQFTFLFLGAMLAVARMVSENQNNPTSEQVGS